MSNRKDILLNEDGSMQIAGGDFVIGYSDGQNGQLLLLSDKGNWRQNPLAGMGMRKLENTKFTPLTILSLKKQIRQQFINDGYAVNSITMTTAKNLAVDYE